VIHQAPLAVPRGVGPKITSDVELDVEVGIDVKGKVTRARVVSTKGAAAGLLAIEALKAAQLFRFRPAQENGRNIDSVMVLTFRFDQIAK
jgi:TonB family protein